MGVLGVGMGLIVSQLGNVVQSAVEDRDRSEAGGLQNTAQQLGSSLGTALLGAIVISGLISRLHRERRRQPADLRRGRAAGQRQGRAPAAASSPPTRSARPRKRRASTPRPTDALVGDYEDAQLDALKIAFLGAALLVVASFFATVPPADPPLRRAPGRARSAGRRRRLGRSLRPRRLLALDLVELDLAQADRLGGDFDALVLAQELERRLPARAGSAARGGPGRRRWRRACWSAASP